MAPKRSIPSNNDIDIFFEIGSLSKRLEVVIEVISSLRASSIDNERCFSVCGRVLNPLRTRIGDDRFSDIVFIYENRNN